MRDVLYIIGLLAAFALLAADFPSAAVEMRHDAPSPVFASFVELSPSVHAAYFESAKTSWQVRSGSRGSPVTGSLDSGIPLLADSIPAAGKVVFREIEDSAFPVGQVDAAVFSLVPDSEGVDYPAFSTKPTASGAADGLKDISGPFPKSEMLSVESYRKIKEIIQ